MVHEFHGACDDIGRDGGPTMLPTQHRCPPCRRPRGNTWDRNTFLRTPCRCRAQHTRTHSNPGGGATPGIATLFFALGMLRTPIACSSTLPSVRFFYQHRSRVGVACAQACALRMGGCCSSTPSSAASGSRGAHSGGIGMRARASLSCYS